MLALAGIAAGLGLGRWQLSRAAQKEALQADIASRGTLPTLDMPGFVASAGELPALLHRKVQLRGLWLEAQTVYLDNRQMGGKPGFFVLTPLALEGAQQTVMVQRGWVPRNFEDRTRLAPVDTPPGLVDVDGRIGAPPARLLDLGHADAAVDADAKAPPDPKAGAESAAKIPGAVPSAQTGAPATAPAPVKGKTVKGGSPRAAQAQAPAAAETLPATPPSALGSSPIRQNLDLDAFKRETRLPLRTDLTVLQSGAASEGLQRDWTAPSLGIERHYGYAFQWFSLSALIAILYVWFQFIAPWRRKARGRRD